MATSPHGLRPRLVHSERKGTPSVKRVSPAFLIALLAVACADPVVVQDRCLPLTDAELLHSLDFMGRYSIGVTGDHLLFSYIAVTGDAERPQVARARWFDATLSPVSDVIELGDARGAPAWRWVAYREQLQAQIWAVPPTEVELPPTRRMISIYALAPASEEFSRSPIELPISAVHDLRLDLTPVSIGATQLSGGRQARAAGAVSSDGPVFALSALPQGCSTSPPSPLLIFDALRHFQHLNRSSPCEYDRSLLEHSATLVSLRDGGLGVLFRRGDTAGEGQLWYSRVGADLSLLDEPPLLAGSTTRHTSIPGGYEPRAAVVGDGTILFTERTEENDRNVCSNLRLVEPDGSNPRPAPWQLPCYLEPGSFERAGWAVTHGEEPPEGSWARTISEWIVVEPLTNGRAALAWGERTGFPYPNEYTTRLTSDVPYDEGVFLATIDGQGRRASERVRVTPPEATAIAGTREDGWPGEFEVQAATEGDVVVVVWRDLRADAPGYYARRFRCAPIGE